MKTSSRLRELTPHRWGLIAAAFVLLASAILLGSGRPVPVSGEASNARPSSTAALVAPVVASPGAEASDAPASSSPDVFIPSDDPEATPEPELIVGPVAAADLRWACAGDAWGVSAAPVFCLPLPPCYFAASCMLDDHAWYQPSKIPAKLLREACVDIAKAHDKTVNRCLADIRGWDEKQGWGVDDYIYADPEAPLYLFED